MQLLQSRRNPQRRNKFILIAVLLAIPLAFGAAILGRKHVMPRYQLWKQDRALAQAREFMKQQDQRNAKIALDVALLAAPGNPSAWRTAAEFLEQSGAIQAIKIRRQIVELSPDTLDDRIALIMTSIRFNDRISAREGLAGMTAEQAEKPEALRAALAFALATNNPQIADALYDRLKAIFPDDLKLRYDHAALRCLIPNPELAAAALAEVEKFVEIPEFRIRAMRWLLVDSLRKKDNDLAKKWSSKLGSDPAAEISDLLQRANVALLIEGQKPETVLPAIQARASGRAADVATVLRWLISTNQAASATTWLVALPTAIASDPIVSEVRAELALTLSKWAELGELLEQGAWGKVSKETVQLALSARLVGERNRADLRKRVWEEAINSAGANTIALRLLSRLAGAWKWEQEMEMTLWAVTRAYPDQTWAQLALFYGYRQKRNAAGMREVAAALRKQDAGLARYQYDWALLSLLTDSSSQWNNEKAMMKTLYDSSPTNPYHIIGYAFALAQTGKGPEALKVIEALSELDRMLPARAPYLAYIYGVNKKPDEMKHYVDAAANADMLDEERFLLRQATDALVARPVYTKPAKVTKPKTPETGTETSAEKPKT